MTDENSNGTAVVEATAEVAEDTVEVVDLVMVVSFQEVFLFDVLKVLMCCVGSSGGGYGMTTYKKKPTNTYMKPVSSGYGMPARSSYGGGSSGGYGGQPMKVMPSYGGSSGGYGGSSGGYGGSSGGYGGSSGGYGGSSGGGYGGYQSGGYGGNSGGGSAGGWR